MQTSSALRLDGYFVLTRQYEVASRFTVDWAQLLERNSAAAAVPAHAWLLDAPQIDSSRRALHTMTCRCLPYMGDGRSSDGCEKCCQAPRATALPCVIYTLQREMGHAGPKQASTLTSRWRCLGREWVHTHSTRTSHRQPMHKPFFQL